MGGRDSSMVKLELKEGRQKLWQEWLVKLYKMLLS